MTSRIDRRLRDSAASLRRTGQAAPDLAAPELQQRSPVLNLRRLAPPTLVVAAALVVAVVVVGNDSGPEVVVDTAALPEVEAEQHQADSAAEESAPAHSSAANTSQRTTADLLSSEWVDLGTPPLSARSEHGSSATDLGVMVWGGQDAAGMLSDGAIYSYVDQAWRPLPTSPLPAGRRPSMTVVEEGIVVGGSILDGRVLSTQFALYRPTTNDWVDLGEAPTSWPTTEPVDLTTLPNQGVLVGSSVVYPLLGVILDLANRTWSATDLPPQEVFSAQATANDGAVFVVGSSRRCPCPPTRNPDPLVVLSFDLLETTWDTLTPLDDFSVDGLALGFVGGSVIAANSEGRLAELSAESSSWVVEAAEPSDATCDASIADLQGLAVVSVCAGILLGPPPWEPVSAPIAEGTIAAELISGDPSRIVLSAALVDHPGRPVFFVRSASDE